jgi:hypothetical protein
MDVPIEQRKQRVWNATGRQKSTSGGFAKAFAKKISLSPGRPTPKLRAR